MLAHLRVQTFAVPDLVGDHSQELMPMRLGANVNEDALQVHTRARRDP